MDTPTSVLHWSLRGEYILFPFLRVDSTRSFIVAAVFTCSLCLLERILSMGLDKDWCPSTRIKRSRFTYSLFRSTLFWTASLLRLMYMLIAMSFNVGLILIGTTTLSTVYFFTELQRYSDSHEGVETNYSLVNRQSPTSTSLLPRHRFRSKAKPAEIFIHPSQSNIARADAAAQMIGLSRDPEHVQNSRYSIDEDSWQSGKGREVARALLGHNRKGSTKSEPFHLGSDIEDSDEEHKV